MVRTGPRGRPRLRAMERLVSMKEDIDGEGVVICDGDVGNDVVGRFLRPKWLCWVLGVKPDTAVEARRNARAELNFVILFSSFVCFFKGFSYLYYQVW